ncbi:glycosyltransferase [Pycnococcus provasolii]
MTTQRHVTATRGGAAHLPFRPLLAALLVASTLRTSQAVAAGAHATRHVHASSAVCTVGGKTGGGCIFRHVCLAKATDDRIELQYFDPDLTTPQNSLPQHLHLTGYVGRATFNKPISATMNVRRISNWPPSMQVEGKESEWQQGTGFVMHSSCSILADNYFHAITEEGPLLARLMSQAPSHAPKPFTVILTNKPCFQKPYRNELRQLLLGNGHGEPAKLIKMMNLTLGTRMCFTKVLAGFLHVTNTPDYRTYLETLVHTAIELPKRPPLSPLAVTKMEPLRVLIVDRGTSATRRFTNSSGVLAAVRSALGDNSAVALIDMENLSIASQAALMQSTHILIGVHGSGLTNLAFLRSGAAVVEMVPAGQNNSTCFRYLISAVPMCLHHRVIEYKPTGGSLSSSSSSSNIRVPLAGDFDADVPLNDLEETVAEVANLVRLGGNEGCLNITTMDNNFVATQLLTTSSEEEERSCSDTSSSLGELSSCDAVTT